MSTCSPLPTTPGVTGTATVRGVPGVRVMRTESRARAWVSARLVDGWWHADSDLADFEPDVITAQNSAITAHNDEPPQTDLCACGHGRDGHYSGRYGCVVGPIGDLCPCAAYRPATPSTERCGYATDLSRCVLPFGHHGPHTATPSPQPEPSGLVERVRHGGPIELSQAAAEQAALACADWLDEQIHDQAYENYWAFLIRREVEGAGS